MGTRIFPEEPCGVRVRVPIRLSRLWRISYQEHGEFANFYWPSDLAYLRMTSDPEWMIKKNDGMRRADDEQNLGSPALQIINLYVVYVLRTVYNSWDTLQKGQSLGGYGHSRPDQSRPMYNGDPGDHLILSRSDDSEDHRWCRLRWNLTRLNFW